MAVVEAFSVAMSEPGWASFVRGDGRFRWFRLSGDSGDRSDQDVRLDGVAEFEGGRVRDDLGDSYESG